MPRRFNLLETLEDDSVTSLFRADDDRTKGEVWVRRFKTGDPDAKAGLLSLFKALQSLGAPNIEAVHEVNEDAEGVFILTSAPAGVRLPKLLDQGPLSATEFDQLAEQLLAGLSAVHDQAIMHGALRAEHVYIDPTDPENWRVRIHGFGQGFGSSKEGTEPSPEVYLCAAPEQWEGHPSRRRTDVYALGCILYQAAAARAPFAAKTLKELRHKHLQHDLRPLGKLAPQLPAWASDWVMRLLAVDADERPRKATIAKELYDQKGTAAEASATAKGPQGKITQAVPSNEHRVPPQGTQPIARRTSSVIQTSRQPAHASSGTVAVPLGQAGRAASPAVVGRPVRARTPAASSATKQAFPMPLVLGIGAVIGVIVLLMVLFGGRSDSAPKEPAIVWGTVGKFPSRVESQPPRRDAIPSPASRTPPVAANALLLHYSADAGMEEFSGKQSSRTTQPGGSVAVWGDQGRINRDNELAHFPWLPERTGIRLSNIEATSANGLRAARPFVEFDSQDDPISILNLAARGDPANWPFGSKAKPGLTLAVVFIHPPANVEHLMLTLRGDQGILSARLDNKNNLKLLAGKFGADLPANEKATPMISREVDCSVASVLLVRWRAAPDRIHYTLANAKGQRFESLTEARKFPSAVFNSFSLGGGPPPAYTNPKVKIAPFRGSIAEVLLYPSELSDSDLKLLESQLSEHYFK